MSDKQAGTSSGQVELDGFIGDWTVNDGRLKLTCLTAGAPPKEAQVDEDPEALAKLLLRELLDEWKRTRP
ncbi:hypothetical protein HNP48_001498 [Acidovorax soli]|uniref:Uncharacterized protein n=1 Tax=Acidovorax soli TaxID=592050 RepID=A0A7X0PBN7_9BURK|nr:hypothetical protein [Acidovorax soli]MBB6558834.1 hypothetical protein [Acidovorax soli]